MKYKDINFEYCRFNLGWINLRSNSHCFHQCEIKMFFLLKV